MSLLDKTSYEDCLSCIMLASKRSNPYKHPRGAMTVTRPLCLVELHTLDDAARRERFLFTSLTFVCKVWAVAL